MADISQITLLDGSVVNLKDSAGREASSTGLLGKVSIAQGVQNKGKILQVSNGGNLELVDPEFSSGDVTGPSSASNNNVVVFDGTTGKLVKDSGFTIGKSVPSDAVFTDTTYESKSAASGGTDESLVTTGEKYIWNSKTSNVGTVTGVKMNNGSAIDPDANGVVDLGTVITSHQDISGKADLVDGKVPSTQLPSYVDDVLEYSSQSSFPLTGETGKIYIAQDTNKTYRWSGSAYVEISESLALGETSSSAYRGDRGAAAYDAAVVNVDSTPTTNSTHLITSGGVKAALPTEMTGASSGSAGASGLVPAPSAGDEGKFLKGDGTWDNVEALPVVTSSDNGKALEVNNGEWAVGNEKINKKYKMSFGSNWSSKTWSGFTNFWGDYIWTDGENVYYSDGSSQYVLNKSTSTWSAKTWQGNTYYSANNIWTDGENIYYSNGSTHRILDKSTSTWSSKTWTGLTNFYGYNIWTDGENIYLSSNSDQYVLDKSTSTWSAKTWTGLTSFIGMYIWTNEENAYYSLSSNQYVLDKSTSTWSAKEWTGLTSFTGDSVWTDGINIYCSNNSNQYILDKSTSTWSAKTWTGLTSFGGGSTWTDGENVYYSGGSSSQYVLDKDNSNKILLGSNGEFSPVDASGILPSDMTGASSSVAGTHGLVPAPAQGDQDKYLKGDGTWDAFSVSSLYRQFWTSTQEITLTLATDSKTYLIYCSGSSSGESGALADSEHGACIIVSNGKYIVLHKGSDITITEASSVLTIDSDENIAMGIIEL